MDHFEKIYAYNATEYHEMIAPEDVEANLVPALERATALEGKRVLDLGSGTGRLPLLLHEKVADILAFDLNFPMLLEQQKRSQEVGGDWPLVCGDNRHLPFHTRWADVVMAGWAIGHLRGWYADNWQAEIGKILRDMERVVIAGGTLIIIETLTTGALEPAPPNEELAEYYTWLEGEWGYSRDTIQTDYQFESVEEAVARTEFFFGPELAETIRQNQWARLPEWTGVWSKQV
ncbi:MAG: class I SAM-dependent methyltransferase [Chloroflexi bacterium]|nr:class I SAM-dependent methyltransferase [Chloroflexota bacterium]